eukprot:14974747-Ditylum_brightwellii.AAC.1
MDELLDKDHELVLLLDANEDTVKAGNFKGFIDENGLIDVYRHLYPDSHPTTYLRGNKQLYYVLITSGLLPAVLAAEILFLGDLSSSVDPARRKLKSTNPQR